MAKSTEIGRAGSDKVQAPLSGLSAGGLLVSVWWKILDPGASPFSTNNYEIGGILAPDWAIRCVVGSCSTNASGIGSMSCNLMLATSSTNDYNYDAYIGDFAFYAGGAGGLTAAQLKAWNWAAWWIEPGSTFTMRQWLRMAGSGGVFLATIGGTDTSTDARHAGASDPPTDFLFPTNYDFPHSNGYAWHPKVHAFASEPTIAQLDAIALQTAPDTSAVGDWLFEAPGGTLNHADQSGHGNTFVDANPGTTTFYEGPDAPLLSVVYQGQSAISYSATSPTPTYPTLLANDGLLLFVAQKPQTANGGTVTTPSGYTLLPGGSKLAAGGYSTTLGADTGNTNYLVYKKDSVTGSESGTLSITTSDNNVAFAWFAQFRSGNGTYSFEVGTAEDTTAGNLSLAFTSINVQAGDVLIAAFAEPTDVTTPSQFSAQAISGTGLTVAFIVELAEADSTTGNDIGGVSYVAEVTAGAGATAVTVTATAGGTTTNVRGPGLLVRVRQGTVSAPTSNALFFGMGV